MTKVQINNEVNKKSFKILRTKHEVVKFYLKSKYDFRFNQMTHRFEKRLKNTSFPFLDLRVEELWDELNCCPTEIERGAGKCIKVRKEDVSNFVLLPELHVVYNPYKEWLKGLDLDDEMRKTSNSNLNPFEQLSRLVGFEGDEGGAETTRFATQLELWMIRAIRCLFDDFYSSKQCIVIAGKQGIGKTPFLRSLLPSDIRFQGIFQNPDVENKDHRISQSKYLITLIDEVDEWLSVNRKSYKSYMTNLFINERKPYARSEETFARITSFLGTCNTTNFLKDPTGTDRWIVFHVRNFLNKESQTSGEFVEDFNVNALWAFSFSKFKEGHSGEICEKGKERNYDRNELFRDESPELDLLQRFFKISERGDLGAEFLSATQIAKTIHAETGENLFPRPLGKALVRLGFRKFKSNGRVGYWVKRLN